MIEYTPTTDEMRTFYTAERLDGPHLEGLPAPTVEQAEAEFDRWLLTVGGDDGECMTCGLGFGGHNGGCPEDEPARGKYQRLLDSQPCNTCGGDRLRPDFTPSGRCHVTVESA